MPSSVRPKGSSSNTRVPPVTPMSERQQMALLMQMTSSGSEMGSRSPSSISSRSRDRNERGWTPLHEACNHGWYEVAFRLVQSGANVNAKGLDNDTPLHDAAINGHLKLVKLLVEGGADINVKNSKGKTPVDVAPAAVKPYLLNVNLPLSESTVSTRSQPRSRDDKKITDSSKQKISSDETMDPKALSSSASVDIYEFKSVKDMDLSSPDRKSTDALEMDAEAIDPLSITVPQSEETANKRGLVELIDQSEEPSGNDDDSRRKKRKDEVVKEGKSTTQRNSGQTKGQGGKQSSGGQNKPGALVSGKGSGDKKSPCSSPKPAASETELEDGKTDLKVPPLKIVIPQTTSNEQESGIGRNGKNSSQRNHQALPYVVASSNNPDPSDKDTVVNTASPECSSTSKEDKKESSGASQPEERGGSSHQRVLRSSHRSGTTQGTDRGSNNSSPQLQRSHSPSPSASPPAQPSNQVDPPTSSAAQTNTTSKSSDSQIQPNSDTEAITSASTSVAPTVTPAPVELHPRKRKMKQNKEQSAPPPEPPEVPAEAQVHPHEQPITNCYELFLNIRNQINKRRRGLFPVQPKPPQGFKDYLMNRCTYVLAGSAPTTPNVTYPQNLPPQMKDLFGEQEKERYRLRTQHVIEKEKLVLSVEQEILRVHGRAARALANQSLPFSVCTILRDEEIYNLITPEQEEKDRNARSRYNGRLFLSWLQDVDDKWEKIKEHMLLRHHNEAESLHAVQKMDWEWKMKELSLCDSKTTPKIEDAHVPMVHVSDDFDLLPT